MDEKDFKKHLQDLAHGHHHPEEHEWVDPAPAAKRTRAKAPAKKTAVKRRARARK